MNFLAHAYLSFNQPELLIGNMISDFVKGKTKFNYSPPIQHGINLHRAIDEFTDAHPATKKAKEFFRPAYRLYAGAFVDVTFDHFLVIDKNEFPNSADLQTLSLQVYQTLEANFSLLPQRFQNIFPYMKKNNWLFNYQFIASMQNSFGGLVYRAKYINDSTTAFNIFNNNYQQLNDCYRMFFPSLKKFSLEYSGKKFIG